MRSNWYSCYNSIRPENLGRELRRRADRRHFDRNAHRTARVCLRAGLWPVLISPNSDKQAALPGESQVDEDWGVKRPTADDIFWAYDTHPQAGVGLRLGAEGRLIDVFVVDPVLARPVLSRLFRGAGPNTLGWSDAGGKFHLLFLWDDRLAAYGKTVIKGPPDYPGLELRLGAPAGDPRHLHTVIPPSPLGNGTPRCWNDAAQILPLPESVFADLDRHVGKGPEEGPPLRGGR